MIEKAPTLLVVGPGPALRWTMEEMKQRYRYKLYYASDPYEASLLIGITQVDAVVCEAGPSYSPSCRFIHEICNRSAHLPVFLFVEPESEDYRFDGLAHGAYHVVRSTTSLEHVHNLFTHVIARHRTLKAA